MDSNKNKALQGTSAGLRTTLVGIIASLLLAAVKFLGGFFGNSYALIADAIESLADVFASAMMWFGLKWSSRPPDKNHPYGHGKAEGIISLFVSLVLVAAAMLIVRDSILHIMVPHQPPAPFTLLILIAVVATKETLYRFVIKTGIEINSSAVQADAFHHRSDAITSGAAFIGISIALIGGKGYEVADDYAAILAGVFILYNAYRIARPAISELLDEATAPALHQKIRGLAESVEGVKAVEKLRSRKMGTLYQVDMHIWVDGAISVTRGHEIAHAVKELLTSELPQIMDVHIHIEPFPE